MAKKKSESKSKNSGFNLTNVLGFKDIFHNEKLNFVLGCILVCVAIYLILAFISYFSTGAADQSLIEDPRDGEVLNAHHEFSNTCGSIGSYASWFFIKRCFGLPAFLIPVFILLLGTNLIRAFKVNLLKWFLSLMILMIWASITLAKFLAPFMTDAWFNPGGDHGAYICQYIENLVGAPGLTALLVLTALAFLTYISAETIFFVRKILNPTRFIDKVKFKITNNDPEEKAYSYEQQIVDEEEPEEEPMVFDDPAPQQVEFQENNKAVVIDPVYTQQPEKPAAPIAPAAADKVDMEIEVAEGEAAADAMTVAPALEDLEPYDPKRDLENYKYPTLDLLKKYDNDGKPYIDMDEQNANKNRIVEVLRTFGVEISSIKALVLPSPSTRSPSLLVSVSQRSVHLKMILPCRSQPSASVSSRRFLVRERWVSRFQMPNPAWYRWNPSLTPRNSKRLRWSCPVPWVRPLPMRYSCSTWPKRLTFSWLVPQGQSASPSRGWCHRSR